MSDIFNKIKSIEPEQTPPGKKLNLTPIIEDSAPTPVSGPTRDKFPNFIHQGSHLNAATAHDVHQPSPLILPIALAAAVIWIICVMAMYFGFFGNISDAGGRLSAAQWISVIMLALIPAIMIGVIAYALQQLSAMSSATTQLTRAARAFSQPDEAVLSNARTMSSAVNAELEKVKSSFDATIGSVSSLEGLIQAEREKLDTSSITVKSRFDSIGSTLLDQHKALEGLADIFDQRMATLSTMLAGHRQDVENSSQLAEHKLNEARVSIEGTLNNLNTTSDKVRSQALDMTTTLNSGHQEIEELGEKLQKRSNELANNYKSHSSELTGILVNLREEQDNLANSLDERLAKMRDMSLSAQVGSESLKAASDAGRQTVEALAEAAKLTDSAVKQRFAEMEDMVRYSNARAESISDKASRRVQDSLAQTRNEISRIEADMAALQDKLRNPEAITGRLDLDVPEARSEKPRGRIQLKPLEEDFPPVSPTAENEAQPDLMIKKPYEKSFDVPADEEDFDLVIEPPSEPLDMQTADPDAEIKNYDADTLRPAAAPELRGLKTRKRTRWGWRDVLTGLDNEQPTAKPEQPVSVADELIVQSLTELGLAPSAIVDDGCIIEACNARKASGELAMSQVVAKRLGDPVRHLFRKMEEDSGLKTNARAYTAQYKIGIESIENDREAIRIRLESDAGRAFLLCDAALNG